MTKTFFTSLFISAIALSCNNNGSSTKVVAADSTNSDTSKVAYDTSFKVEAQSFADIQVLRYQVPGFDQLDTSAKATRVLFVRGCTCWTRYFLRSEKQERNHAAQNTGKHV